MAASFRHSFKGKRIFLTGHTGFKGSWMSIWLSLMGAHVKGYALKPERISLYNKISSNLKNHHSVIADIRDKKKLQNEILNFKPDFIFHLAAQPLVLESYKNPLETFEVNVTGTANLLDAVRSLRNKCSVVLITTDKVYRNIETEYSYKELDPLGGYDPYSASKAAAEIVIESYRLSFFNTLNYRVHKKAIASARAGNVIGGGDYAKDRLLPDIYRSLSKSKQIMVRNPSSVRPWQHVLESLSGYLTLAAAMQKNPARHSSAFNFGPKPDDTLSVEAVVKQAVNSWGNGKFITPKQKNTFHEAGMLKLNIDKVAKELAWRPRWSAKTAIRKTMEWYKNSEKRNTNVYSLCCADINDWEIQK